MPENTSVPFTLVGIDHVAFLVNDMPLALWFYQDVLGCQPGYTYPDIGMEQLWCGNALIVLWDTTCPGASKAISLVAGGRNVDHLCIAIGPVDRSQLLEHLAQHDVKIIEEAFQGGARGEGHAFYILDPFGNKIELKGPAVYPDGTNSRKREQ